MMHVKKLIVVVAFVFVLWPVVDVQAAASPPFSAASSAGGKAPHQDTTPAQPLIHPVHARVAVVNWQW